MNQRLSRCVWPAFVIATACTHARVPQSEPGPEGSAASSSPSVDRPRELPIQGQWEFRYLQQTIGYRVTRNATINALSDSTPGQVLSTNLTHETLVLAPFGSDTTSIRVTATVDSFATTSQGRTATTPPVISPFEVNAVFSSTSGVTVTPPADDGMCNAAMSVVTTDLYNLLTNFPDSLRTGAQWTDTVTVRGCQAGIPITSESVRTFNVIGQVTRDGKPVILVERSDTVNAGGQGMQQQHQISVEAAGHAHAQYYLDAPGGRVIYLNVDQILQMVIKAEGKQSIFRQSLKQEFATVP